MHYFWVLGPFGSERHRAQAQYANFVAQGVGQPSIRGGLRHHLFLGSDGFIERFALGVRALDKLRESPGHSAVPLSGHSANTSAPIPVAAKQWPAPSSPVFT
jgi:hypothetical protein